MPRHVVRQRRAGIGIAPPASLAPRLPPGLRSKPMDRAVDLDRHGGRRHTLQVGNGALEDSGHRQLTLDPRGLRRFGRLRIDSWV